MNSSPVRRTAWWFAAVVTFVTAWCLWLPVAQADVPLELLRLPVVEVDVEGDAVGLVEPESLGIPKGAPLTRVLLRDAAARLMASGDWTNVEFFLSTVPGGVRVSVAFSPRVTVLRVDVLGSRVLAKDEIVRLLQLPEGELLDPNKLREGLTAVRAAYADLGYHHADVASHIRDTEDPRSKVILITVREEQPTLVTSLRFDGGAPPARSHGREVLAFEVGSVLNQRLLSEGLRAAEQAMRRSGFLEARLGPVTVKREGHSAALTIVSYPGPHYTIVMSGEAPLAKGEVAGVLGLETEPLTKALLTGGRERVTDLYRRMGYADAKADLRTWMAPPPAATTASITGPPSLQSAEAPAPPNDEAILGIRIEKGVQQIVAAVSFPGATHFTQDYLDGQLYSYLDEELPGSFFITAVDSAVADTAGAGGKRPFRRVGDVTPESNPRKFFYAPIYEEAIEHIRELYQSEGYLSAKVGPVQLLTVDAHRRVASIPVVEGPQTLLHGVSLRGADILAARDLLEAADLRRGQPFSYLSLEQARIKLTDLYRDRGYYYARIEPVASFSADGTRADVAFDIVEGFRVTVGEIIVRGAVATSESVIRDRLNFARGDLWRPRTATRSQERLLDLGVFSAVNIGPLDAELPERVKPIVVTVTERPGQFLEFTAGFSTGEGIRGGFEYGFRNLFGAAVGISLRVQLAYQFLFIDQQIQKRFEALSDLDRLERNVTLGVVFPYLPRVPDTKLSVNGVLSRDNERDFGLEKFGATVALTWTPLRRLTFSIGEDLEQNTVALFVGGNLNEYLMMNTDPRLERLLRVPEGESVILATRISAAVDLRDNPFNTRKGAYFAVNGEWAHTLETQTNQDVAQPFFSNFIKLGVTASTYLPLGPMVLATQIRVGRIFHMSDRSKTYPNRAFFLGGADTMRGYLQDALIPQDLADQIERDPDLNPQDVVRGADAFALLRAELRFPIISDLYGGVFTDIGNSWADPEKLLEGFRLRPTVGVGLRLATPVGPLAFDYGVVVVRRDSLNENFGAFHFSIGLF